MTEAPVAKRLDWGRWFGRPGRSLTRRLIWLASAWILVALVIAALVLTQAFQESALRRLVSDLYTARSLLNPEQLDEARQELDRVLERWADIHEGLLLDVEVHGK